VPKGVELDNLEVLYPTKEDLDNALFWSASLLQRGKPVPAIDLIISAISVRLGLNIITRDHHFATIKALVPHLKIQLVD